MYGNEKIWMMLFFPHKKEELQHFNVLNIEDLGTTVLP